MRAFAFEDKGKMFYLNVHNKVKSFPCESMNVGQERDFYGPPENNDLDVFITNMESEITSILNSILNGQHDQKKIIKLVNHIMTRTNAFKECSMNIGHQFFREAAQIIDQKFIEIKDVEKTLLEKFYSEISPKIPENKRRKAANSKLKKIKNHPHYIFCLRKIIKEQISNLENFFRIKQNEIEQEIDAVWKECLMQEDVNGRSKFFQDFEFDFVNFDGQIGNGFVLSDCCVVGRYSDKIWRIPLQDIDENNRLEVFYMPVSPNLSIRGTRKENSKTSVKLNCDEINLNLISNSFSFVIGGDWVSAYRSKIGSDKSIYLPESVSREIQGMKDDAYKNFGILKKS